MKKATLLLLVLLVSTASIFLLASKNTHAASLAQVRVEKIDHVIEPFYGGLLVINDTMRMTALNNTVVESFPVGFSLKYKKNVLFAIAYDENMQKLPDAPLLNTGLGVVGYYGATVVFPGGGIALNSGESYTFTVVFGLSGVVTTPSPSVFVADFPLYPSLTQNASTCNVTVVLPVDTTYSPSGFPFNSTQKDGRDHLNHTKDNLPAFSRTSVQVTFAPSATDGYALFSVRRLNRDVTIDGERHISVVEQYLVESKSASDISSIKVFLPIDASSVAAFNERGATIFYDTTSKKITFTLPKNQSKSFSLAYTLGSDRLTVGSSQSYALNLSLSENLRVIAETLTMKIVFPEGAIIQSFSEGTFNIRREVFQETLYLSRFNITFLQDEQWSFTYNYTAFWSSFRPTLWATTFVIITSVVAFAWQRPKAPIAVSVVLVPRKTLNEFVETYEEKKKILSELEQTEKLARKGKISRRRYKIRKTTLENRLSVNSKKLADLRQKVMSGGAKYADMMRQLELSETELDNIEADIRRIEVRFKRGEISAQTYRQLLEGDLQRREKAKNTIDGLLLRLRE